MRRGRIFFYLAFILILALVAAVVIWQKYLQTPEPTVAGADSTPVPAVQTMDVVVVTQHIPRGGVVEPELLGVIPIQQELFMQGMFSNVDDVVGRQAKFDLDAGIPLTEGMLVESAEQLSTTGSNAALSIPRGMVAVSIPVSRLSSVSYAPQAGDHVNVIATMMFSDLDSDFQTLLPNSSSAVMGPGPGILIGVGTGESSSATLEKEISKITTQNVAGGQTATLGRAEIDPVLGQTFYAIPSERQRPRIVSQSFLQDAVVLRLGDFPLDTQKQEMTPQQPMPTPEGGEEFQDTSMQSEQTTIGAEPVKPDIVSLIVSPQDAVTLNYMIFSGAQLTLALRSSGDDTRVETEAVTLQFLLDQYNIPVPVKLPYGMEPRIDELVAPTLLNDLAPTPIP
jgi:Flp pilus assembly protein CpaB